MSQFTPINTTNGSVGGQQNSNTHPPANGLNSQQFAGSFYVEATTLTDSPRENPAPAAQAQPEFYGWTPYMVNGVITNPDSAPAPAPAAGMVHTVAANTQVPAPVPVAAAPTVTLAELARANEGMEVDEIDELLESEKRVRPDYELWGLTLTPRRKRPPTSGRGKKAPNSKGGN